MAKPLFIFLSEKMEGTLGRCMLIVDCLFVLRYTSLQFPNDLFIGT